MARFGWEEASFGGRAELATIVGEAFASAVQADLGRLGFAGEEPGRAFVFLLVQLRRVLPLPEIRQAVAEKSSAPARA